MILKGLPYKKCGKLANMVGMPLDYGWDMIKLPYIIGYLGGLSIINTQLRTTIDSPRLANHAVPPLSLLKFL